MLLVHLILDLIAFLVQVYLSYGLISVTFPEFDGYVRETCSQSDPAPLDSFTDCMPFIQSERVAGFQIGERERSAH
jgi:hypothetical protein